MSLTLTSSNDSVVSAESANTITTTSSNLAEADIINTGLGMDTLTITNQATITTATLANKTGIDVIRFSAIGNSVILNDTFVDTSDNDSLELANSSFTITNLNTSLIGGTGDDIITNGSGNDAINGGNGNDTFYGLNDGDTITGGSGTDTLIINSAVTLASSAFDHVTGIDIIAFSANGSVLSLSDAFVVGADASSVELNNDNFTIASLNTSAVTLGHDVMVAGTGTVTLADGAANRICVEDDTNGSIQGGAGNDSINAASGSDMIVVADTTPSSSNSLNGGSGTDILHFSDTASISTTDLTNVRNIESITFSTDGNTIALSDANVSNAGGTLQLDNEGYTITSLDTSAANASRNVVIGGTGAVTLADNAGNRVSVAEGVDSSITGGSGNHSFILSSLSHSTASATDRITDFTRGEDVIVLSGLGFTGIAAGSASGTVLGYSDNGSVTTITNADNSFRIELNGVYSTLDDTDFTFA